MFRLNTVTKAILLSLLALLFFDLMALVIKRLSSQYSAAELSVYRNIFGTIPSVIALWSSPVWHQSGRKIRVRQWALISARGLIVAGAQLLFYLSLGRMAFATATTISYSGALFMTGFAVLLLGEKVGLIRWLAVMIGFVGVVMIMGPGRDAFRVDALFPVGAAALYALSGVTARLIDDDVPSALANVYSSVFAVIGSLILALVLGAFSPIQSQEDMLWIIAMGIFGGTAVFCLVVSYRMTEQSNLAPFSYFGIPLAFFLGWLFYGELPVQDVFPGAILIAAGGLMVVWRERLQKRRARHIPPIAGPPR